MRFKINNEYFRSEKIFLGLVFSMALIIRVAFVIYQYQHNVVDSFGDDKAYKHFGEEVLRQGIFVKDLNALGSYAGAVGPGIGWILATIFFFFGNNWLPVFIVNSIMSALISVLIYVVGKKLVNYKIAAISSFYSVFYIFFIKYTASGGKDLWMVFFLLVTVYLIIKVTEEHKITISLLLLSVVFEFLFHLDERFLLYSPLFFLIILFAGDSNKIIKIKKATLFAALVIILMIPWTIRNYKVYDRIILISIRTNPFTEKILGYEPKHYLEDDYKSRWYISTNRIDSIINDQTNKYDSGIEITPLQIEAIKRGNLPHDFTKAESRLSSFVRLWQPFTPRNGMYYEEGYRFISWSTKHQISVILSFSWLLIFLPFGLYYLFKNRKVSFYIIICIFLLHTLLHVWFVPFVDDRYRIPIDSFVIISSITGLVFLLGKATKKFRFLNEKL